MALGLSLVVPTLGASPLLRACLEALRRDGGEGVELILVAQGSKVPELPEGLVDRRLDEARNLGFARAVNRGMAAARGDLLGTVNDDVLVQPGWTSALENALRGDDSLAAVQGVQLREDQPRQVDGWGLAWNRRWQAVQLGRGESPPPIDAPAQEIFGASATAVLYRREALEAVAGGGGVFEERLGSYYEDVDLACRLRAAGFRSRMVPAARALHAGSITGAALGARHHAWIHGNRHLVLARLLGRSFWPRLPGLLGRDLKDLALGAARGQGGAVAGIVRGWGRAALRLPGFARFGPPAIPIDRIRALGEAA